MTSWYLGNGRLYVLSRAKNMGPRPRRRGQRARARVIKAHRLRIETSRWPYIGNVGKFTIAPAAPVVPSRLRTASVSIDMDEFNADALRVALRGES